MKHFVTFIGTCAVIWIFFNFSLLWAFVAALVVLIIFYKWPKRELRVKSPAPAAGGRDSPAPQVDGITKAIQNIDPNDPEAAQKRRFFESMQRFNDLELGGFPEASYYRPGNPGHPGYRSRTIPPSHEEPALEGEKRTLH
jgi:hypothetical protein